ncbi:hypothetical protein BJY21_000663 [Kineosphaera limosa]|uniref:Uncharacterized protein n=1 Tax=Kineosphaera limosa NBRC 100340 TaxID=1184609 RepID=K6VP65_9MICO|nr:hypothetical protein [Kineosphaera limosa]NYD99478.1 hypothetical protein [Kineosphaera limosa]GAB98013.1 hypothetical protein KILIM_094_00130 [Kineosphaera limosa NBRC 100340]
MTTDSPLRTQLRAALRSARRARDATAVAAIAGVLATLENAEAVPIDQAPSAGAIEGAPLGVGAADAARKVLTDAQEQQLFDVELAAWREAEETYRSAAPDRLPSTRHAIEVLEALRGG